MFIKRNFIDWALNWQLPIYDSNNDNFLLNLPVIC